MEKSLERSAPKAKTSTAKLINKHATFLNYAGQRQTPSQAVGAVGPSPVRNVPNSGYLSRLLGLFVRVVRVTRVIRVIWVSIRLTRVTRVN